MSLDAMWQRIVTETDQVFTLLAHSQACEDSSLGNTPLINDVITAHRGGRLYLAPAWKKIMASLGDTPIIPQQGEFAVTDLATADAGEVAIKAMWESLGLTFDEYGDQPFHIHVAEPTW